MKVFDFYKHFVSLLSKIVLNGYAITGREGI